MFLKKKKYQEMQDEIESLRQVNTTIQKTLDKTSRDHELLKDAYNTLIDEYQKSTKQLAQTIRKRVLVLNPIEPDKKYILRVNADGIDIATLSAFCKKIRKCLDEQQLNNVIILVKIRGVKYIFEEKKSK